MYTHIYVTELLCYLTLNQLYVNTFFNIIHFLEPTVRDQTTYKNRAQVLVLRSEFDHT